MAQAMKVRKGDVVQVLADARRSGKVRLQARTILLLESVRTRR